MSWAQLWPILVDYQKSIIWFTLCLITEFNFCTVAFCAETNFNAVTHRLGPPQGTGEKLEQRQGFPQVVAHKAPVEERWVIVQLLEWVLTVGMLKTKKFGVNWINIWYLWPLAMPKGCNHVPSFLFAPFFFMYSYNSGTWWTLLIVALCKYSHHGLNTTFRWGSRFFGFRILGLPSNLILKPKMGI